MTGRRKSIGLALKLDVALRQLGLDPKRARLDHNPALERRTKLPGGGYEPDERDPAFMQWLDDDTHKTKTFGRGGERRITTAGSDIGEITKTRHLTEDEEAFRRRLLAKEPGVPRQKTGTIPSRGFPKRRTVERRT